MPIPRSIQQVQNLNPELAKQLTDELCKTCKETLLDIEGLLTEYLDLNVFNTSKNFVSSISTLTRILAQLTGKTVEDVLLEIRHGDSWQEEVAECIPDWADPSEFPKTSSH